MKAFLCVIFAAGIALAAAHFDPSYFRDANDGFNERKQWMATIPGHVRLNQMAIPGTHDSAANGGLENDILFTQCLDFDQQLRSGIRFFDIRIRHYYDSFPLHHAAFFLNKHFDNFLNSVHQFLIDNPTETVLFRLKQEHNNEDNTRSMRETLENYLKNYSTFLKTTDASITLNQARGKFIILSENSEFDKHGISYGNCDIQDDYHLTTNWDLYDKWEKVKSHLTKAKNGNSNKFYINYLSGSGGSFPYFVASGHSDPGSHSPRLVTGQTTPGWSHSFPDFPRVHCFIGICTIAFEGTNVLARDMIKELNNNRQTRTVGIVAADFPGDNLIHEIIRNNWILQ